MNPTPFHTYLSERWRHSIFGARIFPGFPFDNDGWVAIAYDRDREGGNRLPERIWRLLIDAVRSMTADSRAYVISPYPIVAGTVSEHAQPFEVPLSIAGVHGYFGESDRYLPEFLMAGVSEAWAIWGDSDITVLGGSRFIMSAVSEALGGEEGMVDEMARSFRLSDCVEDESMHLYLRDLARGR